MAKITEVDRNLATWDRVLRAVLAAVIVTAWYLGYIPVDLAMAMWVVAGALFLNVLLGKCALYALFGVSTCKVPEKPAKAKAAKGKKGKK